MRPLFCRILVALVLPVSLLWPAAAQQPYQRGYFRSPVDYPITLAGAFGEIRRNHFHSGIDIRTGGVQGKPVYAIADGYVARVNISPAGFGKALYIAHPNGYTSLYAHLRDFKGPVAAWVREQQYKRESFAIDTALPEGLIRVKKGEVIAYSGNSGSSAGPHIHFEIRETRSQEIIDPLDFGFMAPDRTAPRITWVKVYPHGEQSMVNFSDKAVLLPVTGQGNRFRLKKADTVKVTGDIIFGIETSDSPEGSLKTGVHTIELRVDGNLVFSQDIDRFAFADTRYVNSLIDYPDFIRSKRKIQRSYIAPNNRLKIFSGVIDKGVVHFSDAGIHRVEYRVKDVFGNSSTLEFAVRSHPPAGKGGRPVPASEPGPAFSCVDNNRFEQGGLKLEVPADAVYENFTFKFRETGKAPGAYAPVYHLHDIYTPLHTWCTLSIRPAGLPKRLETKALIVAVSDGNKFSAKGGTFSNGWITTRIRDFGRYSVAVDTVPPVIKAMNISPGKKITAQSSILVKISDNLSGIKTYRGTLNGRWILMDYDEKNRLLSYKVDDRTKPGKNAFVLTVTDACGNSAKYEANLVR